MRGSIAREADNNAFVVVDADTGKPLMIATDVRYRNDPSFNPGNSILINIPLDVYNSGIRNPKGVHVDTIEYAKTAYEAITKKQIRESKQEQKRNLPEELKPVATENLLLAVSLMQPNDPDIGIILDEIESRK